MANQTPLLDGIKAAIWLLVIIVVAGAFIIGC